MQCCKFCFALSACCHIIHSIPKVCYQLVLIHFWSPFPDHFHRSNKLETIFLVPGVKARRPLYLEEEKKLFSWKICWESLQLKYLLTEKLWQSPRGKRVVTHWASMLRWIWSISEYNLMTRDSWKRARWVDRLWGNVEGADLKNNSQSTTHVDP